ncbi:MAG: hypothetical protein HY791_28960 [Deltaproteobacteria bacterium]|nr:hypothetical protein [Deltaproteobacteria bacterium]
MIAACATDRYVGSLGSDLVWANRGYGLVLPLSELAPRWIVVDPQDPSAVPPALRPLVAEDAIDLDGDGKTSFSESTRRLVPALRLVSRTSTATLDVIVSLSPVRGGPTLELVATSELIRRGFDARSVERASEAGRLELRAKTADRSARVIAIDQPELVAEEGRVRRQVITFVLEAHELDEPSVADQDLASRALILSAEAAPLSEGESW